MDVETKNKLWLLVGILLAVLGGVLMFLDVWPFTLRIILSMSGIILIARSKAKLLE